ncbi:hypothetical protein V8C44DRAFT_341843 [Trichoderma aethiopicum]
MHPLIHVSVLLVVHAGHAASPSTRTRASGLQRGRENTLRDIHKHSIIDRLHFVSRWRYISHSLSVDPSPRKMKM